MAGVFPVPQVFVSEGWRVLDEASWQCGLLEFIESPVYKIATTGGVRHTSHYTRNVALHHSLEFGAVSGLERLNLRVGDTYTVGLLFHRNGMQHLKLFRGVLATHIVSGDGCTVPTVDSLLFIECVLDVYEYTPADEPTVNDYRDLVFLPEIANGGMVDTNNQGCM